MTSLPPGKFALCRDLHKSRQLTSLSLIDLDEFLQYFQLSLDMIFWHLVHVAMKRSDAKLASITVSS